MPVFTWQKPEQTEEYLVDGYNLWKITEMGLYSPGLGGVILLWLATMAIPATVSFNKWVIVFTRLGLCKVFFKCVSKS